MSLYTVISPKAEYYQLYEDFIMLYSKVKIDLCIKENGLAGDHPHLNIIWDEKVNMRTDEFTRKLKRHMNELPDIDQPVIIRTKQITNINQLIGGYLTKEDNYNILIDSHKYNVDELKEKQNNKLVCRTKWNGIMNYADAPLILVDYCEDNEIDYLKLYCLRDQTGVQYLKDSRGCKRLLLLISREKRVQVHHLLRKSEDIHLGILGLLVDSHFIET